MNNNKILKIIDVVDIVLRNKYTIAKQSKAGKILIKISTIFVACILIMYFTIKYVRINWKKYVNRVVNAAASTP